ncbi:Uncharacterised protein [Bordetella pertussis]|nr:Uncharacterised protein [Bordetella pertussis]CFP67920.1 Uncharacterised protein [Bordetella pertussis]
MWSRSCGVGGWVHRKLTIAPSELKRVVPHWRISLQKRVVE